MFSVTKSFTFDAAHRLMGYEGPCAELHGHTYTAIIEFASEDLDEIGFVVDFADIKKHVKVWIDYNWDHGTLLSSEDDLKDKIDGKIYLFDKKNPTAENIAEELYDQVFAVLGGSHFYLKSITIRETPTSSATYTPFE